MKRYLAVIEIDVDAENDIEAAEAAIVKIRALENPVVNVLALDDALEPWQVVDLGCEDGPTVYRCKPLALDYA